MSRFSGLSIASKLYAIFALLATATVALALAAVVSAQRHAALTDEFEAALQGSQNVERLNGLIYAVVMESRGIYMSEDLPTRKKYADGVLKFPADLDSGWSGEALGKGKAAMVIEGPWISGLKADYPDLKYKAVELPAGPGGPSTFTFSNCWGIPVDSPTLEATQSLVEFLTSDEQQLAFSDAFGVIPSTQSGAASYAEKFPNNASFVAGNDYAVSPVAFAGASAVLGDFNASLEGLATSDSDSLLKALQTNLEAAYAEANG